MSGPEKVVGKSCFDITWNWLSEDGSPYPLEEYPWTITLRTGTALSDVVMGIAKRDGETVWISLHTRPLTRKEESWPCAVVISFSDISERKRAEDAVRVAREELERLQVVRNRESLVIDKALRGRLSTLRFIADSLPVLISYVDAEKRYRFCNRTYELWRGVLEG